VTDCDQTSVARSIQLMGSIALRIAPALKMATRKAPTRDPDEVLVRVRTAQAKPRDLIGGIAAVGAGKTFFSQVIAQSMLEDLRRVANDTATDSFDLLSEREREILQLIAEGHSNKDVALMLSISPATVETHRSHILEKLDVHNTAELVLYAVRRGVIR
jgi:DNA-binding NarL/FixJ family response regulator